MASRETTTIQSDVSRAATYAGKDINRALDAIPVILAALRLADAELTACSEYLDDFADADGDSEGFHPNRAMSLKDSVDQSIAAVEAAVALGRAVSQ